MRMVLYFSSIVCNCEDSFFFFTELVTEIFEVASKAYVQMQ